MIGTFEEAMTLTLGHEGHWYDGSNPRDPNPTMYGVIQKTYDAYRDSQRLSRRTVRAISEPELRDIYSDYWAGTCDVVARTLPRTALCLFDMSINAGSGTARKLLQSALDLAEDGDVGDLQHDGKLGPKTMAMLKRVEPDFDKLLCLWLLMERVAYYDNLAESERQRPNLKSWLGRSVYFYRRYIREEQ